MNGRIKNNNLCLLFSCKKFNNDVHTFIKNLIVNIFVSLVKIFCSRVKLAVNNETEEAVAVKIINIERTSQAEENVRKEVI